MRLWAERKLYCVLYLIEKWIICMRLQAELKLYCVLYLIEKWII